MNLSDEQVHDLATVLVGIVTMFYEDPRNEEIFQAWSQTERRGSEHDTTTLQADLPRQDTGVPQ